MGDVLDDRRGLGRGASIGKLSRFKPSIVSHGRCGGRVTTRFHQHKLRYDRNAPGKPRFARFSPCVCWPAYDRLASDAERLARGLAARGVGPDDRVALHMMNGPEMIVAYYACFKLGAIAAPLRTAFKFAELAPILQRLKPALYIGDMDLYENVAPVDTSILAWDKRFIVNGTFEDHGVQPWEALFDVATDESLSVSPASYEPAVLINTSGTTGQPKFVIHTPATLSESVDLIIKHWGFSADDIVIMPLPMAHMSGLISFLSYIQFGAPFVLLQCFDADTVLDSIERHRCTWCLGFPAHY